MNKIKIYSELESATIFFEGSKVSPKELDTVQAIVHSTLSDRVIIKSTKLFKRGSNTLRRVFFKKLNISRVQNKEGVDLVDTLGYDRSQVLDYLNEEFEKTIPVSQVGEYKGAYDASTNTPDFAGTSPNNGDWYRVQVAGTVDGVDYSVNDEIWYSSAASAWQLSPDTGVKVEAIENASLGVFDIYVDSSYTGPQTGSNIKPFNSSQAAVDAAQDGDEIQLKGSFTITSPINIPDGKSLHFYGVDGLTEIKYSSYSGSNGIIFSQPSSGCSKEYSFNNLNLKNSGLYAIYVRSAKQVNVDRCEFSYNGWSGLRFSTVYPQSDTWSNGGILGYDSTQADLQAFWASSETSNGGALRLRDVSAVSITDCKAFNNLRGLRVQDCGKSGSIYITRNQCYNNIESAIYLSSGSYDATNGCENAVVYNNACKFNSNNGILVIGGISNVCALNHVEGNWNAGAMNWHCSNSIIRENYVLNNNRSQYNGIGNTGDAKASIQISGGTISSDADFITHVVNNQVIKTNLGTSSESIGFLVDSTVDAIADRNKAVVLLDNNTFQKQDIATKTECDFDLLKFIKGDNTYIDNSLIDSENNGNGRFYELPFSNQHTTCTNADFSLDSTGSRIICKDSNGKVLNIYGVNDLVCEAFGSNIRIIQKDSDKIQFDEILVSGCSIGGTLVNSVLSLAVTSLKDLFANSTGFSGGSGGGDPVVDMFLSGYNLTTVLQSGTSYTVDVTTLGVDENKFVSGVSLVGFNLELTMNDSSVLTLDASNMVNGSQLPAISNNWFVAHGSSAGDQIISAGITAAHKDKQPFYNGDFLEKGQEYIWTHDVNASSVIGIWSGQALTYNESEVFNSTRWSTNFVFGSTAGKILETSIGVDVATRFASGYDVTNNTVLSLRYGNDNYLYLIDISGGDSVIIGRSNTALVGDSVTIYFGGGNQPNAKFPVMIKRPETWSIVHDFDNSENGEWNDGVETDTVIKSNISLSKGEKVLLNVNYFGRAEQIGIGYTGASSGVNNASTNISYRLLYNASELLKSGNDSSATGGQWTWNQSASKFYDPVGNGSNVGYWQGAGNNLGLISFIYNEDNSLVLYHEGNQEEIATLATPMDGLPVNIYIGFNESHPTQRIPSISKQQIGQGSQPVVSFAPDVSDQVIEVTESTAFSKQIQLDSGSDIVNQFVEEDAPTWAVLDQKDGVFNGTAPVYNGSSDDYIVKCVAANAYGGHVSFNVTIRVAEQTYVNTTSLRFSDGVSSFLGGNAALVTALERSSNGSGSGDAWTIAFWYKIGTSSTGQTLLYFGNNDTSNNGYIEIKNTQTTRLRLRYGSGNNYLQMSTHTDPLVTGWNHIVVSYNGGTTGSGSANISDYYSRFKIIVNGTQAPTSDSQSNYGYSGSIVGQNFRFGKFVSGNYPKDGVLNKLTIWSSDQSSNASGLYNGGVTQDELQLQAGAGSMNTNYLEPDHHYEVTNSVNTIQDLVGTAHLVGNNFSSSDLVNDAP